jgi:GPCR-chaperone
VTFSDFNIEPKKNWRGQEQIKKINGYQAKKFLVECNLVMSLKKRQVLLEKELSDINSFEEYFQYSLKDSHKSYILSRKFETNSLKKIKASIWAAENFPMKILDLMPLLDLLSSVSQKARRLHELFSSTNLFLGLGFPIRAKVPLFLTVTALIVFKNFKTGKTETGDFELSTIENNKILKKKVSLDSATSFLDDKEEESIKTIGPKIKIIPAPQLEEEEAEITFVKDFINVDDDIKQKLKAVGLHTAIIEKIKKYIETSQNITNDIDILIM